MTDSLLVTYRMHDHTDGTDALPPPFHCRSSIGGVLQLCVAVGEATPKKSPRVRFVYQQPECCLLWS